MVLVPVELKVQRGEEAFIRESPGGWAIETRERAPELRCDREWQKEQSGQRERRVPWPWGGGSCGEDGRLKNPVEWGEHRNRERACPRSGVYSCTKKCGRYPMRPTQGVLLRTSYDMDMNQAQSP